MNKDINAIIMAAGKGTRLYPLTEITPKPLIKINGIPMIENLISSLLKVGIKDITIVTGYKKEQFEYLKDKYGVDIINNPDYDIANNISSLYYASNKLGNTYILDGDQNINDLDILKNNYQHSGYICIPNDDTFVNEWILELDKNNKITKCHRSGARNGYILKSFSYWNDKDGEKLKKALKKIYIEENKRDIYWDDVAMFELANEFELYGYIAKKDAIIEVDSLDELIALDKSYGDYRK